MNRTKQHGSVLRGFAALTLFVWFTAHGLCAFHCAFGGSATKGCGKGASCQRATSHHNKSNSSSPCGSKNSGACVTFKQASLLSELATLDVPPLVASIAAEIVLAVDADLANNPTTNRQPWQRDRLNTLEVCLGPAHPSLAPPVLI